MDQKLIEKLNETVKKLKYTKEWQIDDSARLIMFDKGDISLAEWLAKTMSQFEMMDVNDFMYADIAESFNEAVDQAITHNVLIDNVMVKELEECKKRRSDLELELRQKKIIISELEKQRDFYQQKKESYEERYPTLCDSDTQQGGVSHD